jgi:hypothetical protein
LTAKFIGHFSSIVPLSLLEVCRVVDGVGAPGSTSGNFQSRSCTISLQAVVLPAAIATGARKKKKKKRKRKKLIMYYNI